MLENVLANVVGAVLAFLVGIVLITIGFLIARRLLKQKPTTFAVFHILKQFAQMVFLAGLFFLGQYTQLDSVWLLAGGGLGLILPSFWFTRRLVKYNDTLTEKEDASRG